MSIITGALKWDLFVVYIIMCVIFISLCCCSITFMFLCCPAKKENVKNNQYSPITPFPTTGLAASIALRTAEIAAVNSNGTCNGQVPGGVHKKKSSLKIEQNSIKIRRNKKVARFAEQKSNSIDVPSFSTINENKPSSSDDNGNKISSKAIVEPIPSDMIERCGSIKENNLKHHQKGITTADVGTMTPTKSLKFNGNSSNTSKRTLKSNKAHNNSDESTSFHNPPRDVSNENNIAMINIPKGQNEESKNTMANDLELLKSHTLKDVSMQVNGISPQKMNYSNGLNSIKTETSITSSNREKIKRGKKNHHTLQTNSFKHSVKGNNIKFEFANSSPLRNIDITNENTSNCSSPLLKSKCNEMLSQPKDQKANIEYRNEKKRLEMEEIDRKNMSYRQGLFVIYVDETYVDL